MRPRLTQKVKKVNLSEFEAFQIKGRSKSEVFNRMIEMRTYEIREMFRTMSLTTLLSEKAEIRCTVH